MVLTGALVPARTTCSSTCISVASFHEDAFHCVSRSPFTSDLVFQTVSPDTFPGGEVVMFLPSCWLLLLPSQLSFKQHRCPMMCALIGMCHKVAVWNEASCNYKLVDAISIGLSTVEPLLKDSPN